MDVKVRFRFNQVTGEVEIFEVTDEGTMRLSEAEHNREHDRIAAELGNIIERNPQIMEAFPGLSIDRDVIPEQPNIDEPLISPEIQDKKQRQTE
ncbi:hypothetical protein [Nostoc sp.]|uniref:hypothetical protein n=1 Tax=Nostoc sp. TaxID=1180 RepID=UPI002FF528C6